MKYLIAILNCYITTIWTFSFFPFNGIEKMVVYGDGFQLGLNPTQEQYWRKKDRERKKCEGYAVISRNRMTNMQKV